MTAIDGLAQRKGLTTELTFASNIPKVWIDARATQSVFDELLRNALSFTENGGSILVTATTGANEVVVEVSDTGVGIPDTDIDRVVFPFEKANNALSKEKRGYGLGLSLASALIKLQGGRLELSSCPGQGTTARIVFSAKQKKPALEEFASPAIGVA